jgi:quinol monooxygenase YgiN
MIIVLGTYEVDAAERDRFLETKAPQVASTRTERGCVDYAFSADPGDPTRVRLVERWESMDDLAAHVAGLRATPAGDGPAVGSTIVEVEVFEAQPVRPPWA